MKITHVSKWLLVVILIQGSYLVRSQNIKPFNHTTLAEKIYLQFDNETYLKGTTVWFKAVLMNSGSHLLTFSSKVLYVDLIDPNKDIVQQKLIRISEGVGQGHFDLGATYKSGNYLIRAYTEWNKNFGSDYMFERYITVYDDKSDISSNSIENLQITTISDSTLRVVADINVAKSSEERRIKELELAMSIDGMTDTLMLTPQPNGTYNLEYQIPKASRRINLSTILEGGATISKSFSPQNSYVNLQFFPEGGEMVDGISSKIGYKCVDINGRGTYVSGKILNSQNEVVASFSSNVLGMGSFILNDVQYGELYTAEIFEDNERTSRKIILPRVAKFGTTLAALERKDSLIVKVTQNYDTHNEITLVGFSRGAERYRETAILASGQHTFKISKSIFPQGIIAFRVLNSELAPLAERLFFNTKIEERVSIKTSLNKKDYHKREKTTVQIQTHKANGSPLVTNTSVLIVPKEGFEDLQNGRENLLSYFLVNSDIRGPIESPGFYFRKINPLSLEPLLLTQGWRHYIQTKKPQIFNYKKEQGLSVSGVVNYTGTKFMSKEAEFTLMTFGDVSSVYSSSLSVPGSFNLNLNDLYGESIALVLQPMNVSEKEKTKFHIGLNKKRELPLSYDFNKKSIEILETLKLKVAEEKLVYRKNENKYYTNIQGITQLDEVVVEGYNVTPERKKVNDKYGYPDSVINASDLIESYREEYSNGVYSTLKSGFQDKVTLTRTRKGGLIAKSAGSGKGEVTFILVDGIPVKEYELSYVQYMLTKEIVSVEIIENARNLNQLFLEVYSDIPLAKVTGSVIAFYTKSGRGLYGALNQKESLKRFYIQGYDVVKTFYAPTYPSDQAIDWGIPDLRYPIYWNPQVITNKEGTAKLDFYNSDVTGKFMIILESISNTGMLGYELIEYEVGDKDPK